MNEKVTVKIVRDRLPKIFKVKKNRFDDRKLRIEVDLNKITFEQANSIVKALCNDLNMYELSSGCNLLNNKRDWCIQMFKDDRDRVQEIIRGKSYSDLFNSVRQRVAAFKYYKKYYNHEKESDIDELLDSAYRFLNMTPDVAFLDFCAKKEKMGIMEYVEMLLELDNLKENSKNQKEFAILNNEITLKSTISTLEAIIAGALPFLVLYDCGRYDSKKTLIEKIYKARDILQQRDPNNKHIIEMFEDWSSKGKSER